MSSSKNSDKTPLVSGEDIEGCVDNGEETDRNNKNVSGKNTQVSGMSMDSNNPSNQLQINNQPFQVDVEETTGTPRSTPERRTEKEGCKKRCIKRWKTGFMPVAPILGAH